MINSWPHVKALQITVWDLRQFVQKFGIFRNLHFKIKYVEVLQNIAYFGKFKSLNILTEYLKLRVFWLQI